METIKEGIELSKEETSSESLKKDLVSTLDSKEDSIPDWKDFDINSIADIDNFGNPIINLKNVQVDTDGNKYIVIKGRKYYEYSPESSKDSIYVQKGNNLFVGDKPEGLAIRMGVVFRYSSKVREEMEFTQTKAKFAGGVYHLQQIYKSINYTASETLTIIRRRGRLVKVTKNMVEKYLKNPEEKELAGIIELAKKQDPEFFAYMQSLGM